MRKDYCITLNRVSSSEQEESGYSLNAQEEYSRKYANEKSFNVVLEYTFQESASKLNQHKKFDEMVEAIDRLTHPKKGKYKLLHLIVEKPDRLTRNHSRKEIIFEFIKEKRLILHYYREKRVLDHEITPEQILMEDVMTSVSKHTANNIARESQKGTLQKAKSGWFPHKPPVGYINNPDKKSPEAILVSDEERAFVLRLFELRGEHRLSYQAIVDKLREEKLVPARYKKTFRKSSVEKWLKSPFYGGKFSWKGEIFDGKHELIVPKSLYAKVISYQKQSGRPVTHKHKGTFSDMFTCSECGCKITYHNKTKPSGNIYQLYVCANGKKQHKTLKAMYKNESVIMEAFHNDVLDRVNITAEFAEKISEALKENHKKSQEKIRRDEKVYRERKNRLLDTEEEYFQAYMQNKISNDLYEKKRIEIRRELEILESSILEMHNSVNKIYMYSAEKVLELAKNAKSLWLSRTKEEQVEFMEKLLWNSKMSSIDIEFNLKKPFKTLVKIKEIDELEQKSQSGLNSGLDIYTSEKDKNVKWGDYLDEFGIDCMSHAI